MDTVVGNEIQDYQQGVNMDFPTLEDANIFGIGNRLVKKKLQGWWGGVMVCKFSNPPGIISFMGAI